MSRNSVRLEKYSLLNDLLRRYCDLNEIKVEDHVSMTKCTFPSGVLLTIYKQPVVEYSGDQMIFIYGYMDNPRKVKYRFLYFDEKRSRLPLRETQRGDKKVLAKA
jgi:hypothetical protein